MFLFQFNYPLRQFLSWLAMYFKDSLINNLISSANLKTCILNDKFISISKECHHQLSILLVISHLEEGLNSVPLDSRDIRQKLANSHCLANRNDIYLYPSSKFKNFPSYMVIFLKLTIVLKSLLLFLKGKSLHLCYVWQPSYLVSGVLHEY